MYKLPNSQLLPILRHRIFSKFTDAIGGDPDSLTVLLYEKFIVEDFSYSESVLLHQVLSYFENTVIPHKIEVYKAGIQFIQMPAFNKILSANDKKIFRYNLFVHDLSKFSLIEATGYSRYDRKTGVGKEVFTQAWHHHKINNPHHPEHWLNPDRDGACRPVNMPNLYIIEMLADWIGAGKTYGNTLEQWLPENISSFRFGNAKVVAEMITNFTGIDVEVNEVGVITTKKQAVV